VTAPAWLCKKNGNKSNIQKASELNCKGMGPMGHHRARQFSQILEDNENREQGSQIKKRKCVGRKRRLKIVRLLNKKTTNKLRGP
jgi:hypothetical protein